MATALGLADWTWHRSSTIVFGAMSVSSLYWVKVCQDNTLASLRRHTSDLRKLGDEMRKELTSGFNKSATEIKTLSQSLCLNTGMVRSLILCICSKADYSCCSPQPSACFASQSCTAEQVFW